MPNFREVRACITYAYGSNFISEQEFVLLYECHKSTNPEFLYWNYDMVRFRREIKRRIQGRVSFLLGGHLLKDFSYSNLLFIHTVSCFDRFQCWLNSQRSPWHCRRSFLERNRHTKFKSNVKDMPLM